MIALALGAIVANVVAVSGPEEVLPLANQLGVLAVGGQGEAGIGGNQSGLVVPDVLRGGILRNAGNCSDFQLGIISTVEIDDLADLVGVGLPYTDGAGSCKLFITPRSVSRDRKSLAMMPSSIIWSTHSRYSR